jgi:heat shock protein HtpX
MEMCVDNPRTDFSDIFATHPPIDKRVEALVKFAGGHDPGPLALDAPEETPQLTNEAPAGGPWGGAEPDGGKPFLPGVPPIGGGGPWGPKRG